MSNATYSLKHSLVHMKWLQQCLGIREYQPVTNAVILSPTDLSSPSENTAPVTIILSLTTEPSLLMFLFIRLSDAK